MSDIDTAALTSALARLDDARNLIDASGITGRHTGLRRDLATQSIGSAEYQLRAILTFERQSRGWAR